MFNCQQERKSCKPFHVQKTMTQLQNISKNSECLSFKIKTHTLNIKLLFPTQKLIHSLKNYLSEVIIDHSRDLQLLLIYKFV